MLQDTFSLLLAANHPGNLMDPLLRIQARDMSKRPTAFLLLVDEIMTVCIGSNLRQMSDANDLILPSNPLKLPTDRVSSLPSDTGVDLVEHERFRSSVHCLDRFQG